MYIRILPESKRRMAWTDRIDGYFEFFLSSKAENNGYHRKDKKFLSGFSSNGHGCSDAKHIDVYPQGFKAVYAHSVLEVSLLLDEQAFYIFSQKNAGILNLYPASKIHEKDEADSFVDISPQKTNDNKIAPSVSHIKLSSKEIDGITIVSSPLGFAVAADFNFNYSLSDGTLELFKDSEVKANENPFSNSGWYAVFENSEEEAINKSVRLVKQKAVKAHTEQINLFLDRCYIKTGDKRFDESVLWASFSSWLLATKDKYTNYRGIWAGLPWFRDNWGRDTFIAISGTLLVSGCFDEAKDVLLGFAKFQDLDKESPSYGRIPNRYRNENDVIYNTVDGTLWFIRALWEYVQYSGDKSILSEVLSTVEIALDADICRSDEYGFLKHGDADTWMDARIKGNEPWSPRGDRANDVQALWFTALQIGSFIMNYAGKTDKAELYKTHAAKIKENFTKFFWNESFNALADRLPPGGYGEWVKDMKVRPNQLLVLTAQSVLSEKEENRLIDKNLTRKILCNVDRELVTPFGLYSLTPEDPIFHPEHEDSELYNKDAAYHNGTIWEWNSGPYISSAAKEADGLMPLMAASILQNESKMIMDLGCAGSLSENIHANTDESGNPKLSGTFSQAWSVSEFTRNVFQDMIGFIPKLEKNELCLSPKFPAGINTIEAKLPFGKWKLFVLINRTKNGYKCTAKWETEGRTESLPKDLKLNGINLVPDKDILIKILDEKNDLKEKTDVHVTEKFSCPTVWIKNGFPLHKMENKWWGSTHIKNYLENLILSGRLQSKTSGGTAAAELEWFFDSEDFKKNYITDTELGCIYSKRSSKFRVWAPTAKVVNLALYKDGEASPIEKLIPMKKSKQTGVWETEVKGDLHCTYYLYKIYVHGTECFSPDPYAKAAGINGNRSMVINMEKTNPADWEKVCPPVLKNSSDAIIYEAHIADISSSPTWNGSEENRRLFAGAAESKTSYKGMPTGFDHIRSLGITHMQLLPIFDFRSVDEKRIHDKNYAEQPTFGLFNWGYDPQNYGLPEGSYSSDPYKGEVRIKEFKSLVKTYAENGIGIIMDVVFNHVNDGIHHALNMTVPGYFYRIEGYSGAGEDTASERKMFSKYMVDMLAFWLKEYKLCGFRFDLMGLHDTETLNNAQTTLRKIKKDVLLYGEGWAMYHAGKMTPADMCHAKLMPGIGFFNDAFRCAIKGPVFSDSERGYIHNGSKKESIKFGLVGATFHHQVENARVEGTANPMPWSEKTCVSVNYTEIHDNMTMYDKLNLVDPNMEQAYYTQLQKMGISLVLLAQGIPALHAGMEFLRTKEIPKDILKSGAVFHDVATLPDGSKSFLRNSYNVCDKINALDWNRCFENRDFVNYVKKLISFRKAHCALRIQDEKTLNKVMNFADNIAAGLPEEVIAWQIDGTKCGDAWKRIFIIVNPLNSDIKFALPENEDWYLVTDGIEFSTEEKTIERKAVLSAIAKTVSVYGVL